MINKLIIFVVTAAIFVETAASTQGDSHCDISECSLFNVEVLRPYIRERIKAAIRDLAKVDDTTAFDETLTRGFEARENAVDEKVDARFFDLVENQPGKVFL